MKKILIAFIIISGVACSNPEENARGVNQLDSIGEFKDGDTYNTMPGPASPDTIGGLDRSHADSNRRVPR